MKLQLTVLAAAMVLGTAFSATAQTTKSANEYERNLNAPPPKQGTKESRSAERKAQRAEMSAANKAGELPKPADEWTSNKNNPAALAGTSESRSADRKAKRGEMKQVVKAGDLPVTNEADVNKSPTKTR